MKILLIGNGGREHAIADALARSKHQPEIINFGSAVNPGINALATEVIVGDFMDMEQVFEVAQKVQPDFAIVGPDDPIGAGASDAIQKAGIPCFAPKQICAQLESSKSFTRNLLQKYGIEGSPDFYVSEKSDDPERKAFYERHEGSIVVKADGLLGGKGVIVANEHFQTFEEADDFAQKSIEKFGRVVLEEKLIGQEFSLISIVDGTTVLDTPAIQDYKRAYEDDEGPNTGGMGCISDKNHSLPFITKQDLETAHQITVQTMKAIKEETGEDFIGVMYGGFIATKKGTQLIEYNARFGDPEALNILPILKTDFVDVCLAAINQDLASIGKLEFEPVATVVRYLCPEGYPTNSVKNVVIKEVRPARRSSESEDGSQESGVRGEDARTFFSSISEEDGQLLLKGSRAIGILGTGKNLQEARKDNEARMNDFEGPLFYRKDIGSKEMIEEKVKYMEQLRKNVE